MIATIQHLTANWTTGQVLAAFVAVTFGLSWAGYTALKWAYTRHFRREVAIAQTIERHPAGSRITR